MSVCVCVSAPEAINYIHMILNLYNQLKKFVAFRNITKETDKDDNKDYEKVCMCLKQMKIVRACNYNI